MTADEIIAFVSSLPGVATVTASKEDGNSITFMAKPNAREGNSCERRARSRLGRLVLLLRPG